ncbi:hypothetical protein PROFUN_05863 [Planoprotostelium fungivorum]|uniref:Homeobox domain-containing protein n=1 Tax=Planoprotostelium fungivorum TaxID=1890364 RepID=A0A2P6NKR3_9EUKA|nr:hypothetical protein PROFUN_05863 [Planoprotostelium fungivorum]
MRRPKGVLVSIIDDPEDEASRGKLYWLTIFTVQFLFQHRKHAVYRVGRSSTAMAEHSCHQQRIEMIHEKLADLQRQLMVDRMMRRGMEDDLLDAKNEIQQISDYIGVSFERIIMVSRTHSDTAEHMRDKTKKDSISTHHLEKAPIPTHPNHQDTSPPQEQRAHLERELKKRIIWTHERIQFLSQATGLTESQIWNWYRRRRKTEAVPRQPRQTNDHQYHSLCAAFHRDGRSGIPKEERRKLGESIGMEEKRVKKWHENHPNFCRCVQRETDTNKQGDESPS